MEPVEVDLVDLEDGTTVDETEAAGMDVTMEETVQREMFDLW